MKRQFSDATFATVRSTGDRLKVGMVIDLGGEEGLYEVTFVNDCRAHIEPLEKMRTVVIKNRFAEEGQPEEKTFQARRKAMDISPNSTCPIVAWNKPKKKPQK
jgi:hypothetical protein